MSKTRPGALTDVSPDRGPFVLHAWLEFPYYFPMDVLREFSASYKKSESVRVRLEVHSPAYKVVTGNSWTMGQEVAKWGEAARAGREQEIPRPWGHEFVQAEQIEEVVDTLRQSGPRYIHVEEVPAFVKLTTQVPSSVVPDSNFQPFALSPGSDFFRKEVLPELQDIVETYRVAASPYMRYSILPVSEALVDKTIMRFSDSIGEVLQNVHYGFDPQGSPMRMFIPRPDVAERFAELVDERIDLEPEVHFSASYYLFRMRRWAEAVAIASSATEYLQNGLVGQIASTEIEGQALIRAYRYQELFKAVFPEFGLPKLSEADPDLWREFVEAKRYRGIHAHGHKPSSYDPAEREEVARHLTAFYQVSRWLSLQMNRPWRLDFDHNGELLDPFP